MACEQTSDTCDSPYYQEELSKTRVVIDRHENLPAPTTITGKFLSLAILVMDVGLQ